MFLPEYDYLVYMLNSESIKDNEKELEHRRQELNHWIEKAKDPHALVYHPEQYIDIVLNQLQQEHTKVCNFLFYRKGRI